MNTSCVKNPDDIFRDAYKEFLDRLISNQDYTYLNYKISEAAANNDKGRWNLYRKARQDLMDELEYEISVRYGISNISYYGEDV